MFSRPLRLGIDGREFTEKTTGIARLLVTALQELRMKRPGWDIVVFGNQHSRLPSEIKGVFFRCIPEHFTFWWDQVTLANYLRKEKIDLFLSPYYKIPLFPPCPVINILHDVIIVTNKAYRTLRYFLRRSVFVSLGFFYTQRSQCILTDSFYSRRCIQRLFKVPEGKIRVVYPALASGFQKSYPQREITTFQENYRFSRPYLLYVGNFKPHKRIDSLLVAYGSLPKGIRDRYSLVLTGRLDPYGEKLKALARRLDLSHRVFFTDYVDEEALRHLYQNASLFVFPSSEEGFGLPLLEAMASGVPIVATNVASIPEVVGDAALLVPPGDPEALSGAMKRLIDDELLRQSLIDKGMKRATSFSVERQSQMILDAMEALMA